jgi:hypothetical protein
MQDSHRFEAHIVMLVAHDMFSCLVCGTSLLHPVLPDLTVSTFPNPTESIIPDKQ